MGSYLTPAPGTPGIPHIALYRPVLLSRNHETETDTETETALFSKNLHDMIIKQDV